MGVVAVCHQVLYLLRPPKATCPGSSIRGGQMFCSLLLWQRGVWQGRPSALLPAASHIGAHAIMWHHTCTMLYDDNYFIMYNTLYGARRDSGGEMLCSLPGKQHRRHMRLCNIITCTLFYNVHYHVLYSLRGSSGQRRRKALLPAQREHCIGCTCTTWYYRHYVV